MEPSLYYSTASPFIGFHMCLHACAVTCLDSDRQVVNCEGYRQATDNQELDGA